MLPEISLSILDIAENSVSAGSSLVSIYVSEDTVSHRLKIRIDDNGKGMTPEQLSSVTDPFFTSRTTRKIGLGIPFFKQEAEISGGSFDISSEVGKGTEVRAEFCTDNIDCMPLGDINQTILSLITMHEDLNFYYRYEYDGNSFELDTVNIKKILDGVSFQEREVFQFLKDYLTENMEEARRKP